MLKSVIHLVKRYFFPPIDRMFFLALLTFSGTVLVFAFGGETQIHIEGTLFGVQFSTFYENKPSLWLGSILFLTLISVALWFLIKIKYPPVPRHRKIAELEDAYQKRGSQDSVCNLFRETYGVYVSPAELDNLMQGKEVSFRARCLKNARPHVKFVASGFKLKSPKIPYRLAAVFFLASYATAVMLCISFIGLVAVAVAGASYLFAAKLFLCFLSFMMLTWASFAAYSALNSAFLLTAPTDTL